ncbi:MAG: hypothetical protein JOZ57_07645, partial [Abitibacteriaceae bacterium]|nr:hypothetical protein [Abditibacteriaceae bacterium]
MDNSTSLQRLPATAKGTSNKQLSATEQSLRKDGGHCATETIRAALQCSNRRCGCRSPKGNVHCPSHPDNNPSLSVATGRNGRPVCCCHSGCSQEQVIAALKARGLWPDGSSQAAPALLNGFPDARSSKAAPTVYDYRDTDGSLLFQVVRDEDPTGKKIKQRRPDKSGGWIWNLEGVRRVLYQRADVLQASIVFIVEGEKCADCLNDSFRDAGLYGKYVATTNSQGAGKWLEEYSRDLENKDVVILPDNDDAGYDHAQRIEESLQNKAKSIQVIKLPGLAEKEDIFDWLEAGHALDELLLLIQATAVKTTAVKTLKEVEAVFDKYLVMPDHETLYATLGTVAANYWAQENGGEATWLALVAPPASGKTEHITALAQLPHTYMAAELSVAALLSGTPRRDKAKDAHGGLLNQIGSFGILLLKDFTTILSMKFEKRAELLAALREIYDGSWTRYIGTDGGRTLSWEGKLGVIVGVTEAIDTHHAVINTMGERFLFFRLPSVDEGLQNRRVEKALCNIEREPSMRAELAEAVASLFNGIEWSHEVHTLDSQERRKLADLASLAARCRSAVERDSYTRDITNIPDAETPTRIAQQLSKLFVGILIIGVPKSSAWQVLLKIAQDSMPKARLRVFRHLAQYAEPCTTSAVAAALNIPLMNASRALEELNVHGVVSHQKPSKSENHWQLTTWARGCYARITSELPVNSPIATPDVRKS